MNGIQPRVLFLVVIPLFAATFVAMASPSPRSTVKLALDATPQQGTLPEAIDRWVTLVEKDDLKAAQQTWARDAGASSAMQKHWPLLKDCHRKYDYRRWIDGKTADDAAPASRIGDVTKFTVGGHSFGHLHVLWEKTKTGWRVADVMMCR